MEYDIARLTFLDDPMTYQADADEICAHVPGSVSSEGELVAILRESLGFPEYCAISWWNTLEEVLRYWNDWSTAPRRVVILHDNLPFVQSSKDGWFSLQIYLQILIQSITLLQEKNATEIDPMRQRELVAIFPSLMSEELQAILTHPPAWRVAIGFYNYDIDSAFDPSILVVLEYLNKLDGLTAEICTLSRKDVGYITVHYHRSSKTYAVDYQSPDNAIWMAASIEENSSLPSAIPLTLASQILETFFTSSQRSSSVHWSVVDQFKLEAAYERSYFHNAEEACLKLKGGMTRSIIADGVYDAIGNREPAFSLEYWQSVLALSDAPLSQRLAALCIVGLSDLPNASALLRPFLHSSIKQERWVGARFLGVQQDEQALPILLSMLTDELPLQKSEGEAVYDAWYDSWRIYAPQLLRKWPTPEINERLRQSLALWVQAEPSFDPEFDVWLGYEKAVCYELGYQGDLSALAGLPLEGEHRKELTVQIERGYKVKQLHMTPDEEYRYLRYREMPKR